MNKINIYKILNELEDALEVAIKDGDQKTFINRRGISDRLKCMSENLWKMEIPESFIGKKARCKNDFENTIEGIITKIDNQTKFITIESEGGKNSSYYEVNRVVFLEEQQLV
ncbi:hypothetical protein KKB43_05425 [Patescibacteria group bacterium]|nr:hypothetical protein [Patescibacteria group bacterium]MBU4580427.1 hypothetical protein [Patescibacteria group bacterium]